MKTMLYHAVPNDMQGTVLYPLNKLRDAHPKQYVDAMKKYEGREVITTKEIKALGCMFNDVLHLTPVNPEEIYYALEDAGKEREEKRPYYVINPATLEAERATVYKYDEPRKGDIELSDTVKFNEENLAKYSVLPEAAKKYYQDVVSKKKRILLYHFVPHVFYKGEIDISNAEIVEF